MSVAPSGFRNDRAVVLDWVERGAIPEPRLSQALAVTGVTPTLPEWRAFLDTLLLWCGAAALGGALIFFIAANWNALGRYAKFGLVEAVVVGAVLAAVKLGLDRLPGKAALLVASLALGGLLALVGQTYQTGADTWQLFAAWAALIVPWMLVSRFAALWIVWMALVNLATALYVLVSPNVMGIVVTGERTLWFLFILNTVALGLWETLARRLAWLDERWAVRLLFVASAAAITPRIAIAILDDQGLTVPIVTYLAWLAATYVVYRLRLLDVFMLAGACLSAIVTVTVLVWRFGEPASPEGVFLLTAVLVIGMTAAAAIWLRSVAAELQT